MRRRKETTYEMRPVHGRDRDGVTHAVANTVLGVEIACGAPRVPGCMVTTLDPIDCMTCLSRGFESDTHMATIPIGPGR